MTLTPAEYQEWCDVKVCTKCGKQKPSWEFHKGRGSCKTCSREREKKRYKLATASGRRAFEEKLWRAGWRHLPRSIGTDGYEYVNSGLIRVGVHRLEMMDKLGEPLKDDETVHHKNKIKTDNRPGNLELWLGGQPTGARIEDLLEHAKELLAKYLTSAQRWEWLKSLDRNADLHLVAA